MNLLEISSYLFRHLREFPGDLTCMCGSANLYNFANVTWVPMLNTTRGIEKPPGTIQLLRALKMLYLEWWETISNTFFLCTCSCKQESFTTGALGRSCYKISEAVRHMAGRDTGPTAHFSHEISQLYGKPCNFLAKLLWASFFFI